VKIVSFKKIISCKATYQTVADIFVYVLLKKLKRSNYIVKIKEITREYFLVFLRVFKNLWTI